MRIHTKLLTSIIAIALIPTAVAFLTLNTITSEILIQEPLLKEQEIVNARVHSVEELLENMERELHVISEYPPVQGILRAAPTGVDPQGSSTVEDWKLQLQNLFSTYLSNWSGAHQLRFIDENGEEIVRVNRRQNNVYIVEEDALQNKAERLYFREASKIHNKEIFISDITLNEENGVIEEPYVPVIRMATPIFDDRTGLRKGMVVMNYLAEELLKKIELGETIGETILLDQQGFFLLHPDPKQRFALSLVTEKTYYKEEPELERNVKESDNKLYFDEEKKEYLVWQKVFYNPQNEQQYWILLSRVDESLVKTDLHSVQKAGMIAMLLCAAFILAIGFALSRSIAKPLQHISSAITSISMGDLKARLDKKILQRDDEIGELATAFKKTVTSIKMAMRMTSPELRKEKAKLAKVLNEQQEISSMLERKNAQFEEINNALNASSLVSKSDVKGNITYVNRQFVLISKYEEHELINQNHRIIKSGFHSPKFFETLWKTIAEGNVWQGDIRNRAKDGSIYWVRTVIAPLVDENGRTTGYVAVRTPISSLMCHIEKILEKIEQGETVSEQEEKKIKQLREGTAKRALWIQKCPEESDDEA